MSESMVPGTRVWAHRGMADDGTHTWDVGGKINTVTAQTIFLDKWKVSNERLPTGDPLLDTPLEISQVVNVTP